MQLLKIGRIWQAIIVFSLLKIAFHQGCKPEEYSYNSQCYTNCPAPQINNPNTTPKTCDPCPLDKPYQGPDKTCLSKCPDNQIFDANKICTTCSPGYKVPNDNSCSPTCQGQLYNSLCVADCVAPYVKNDVSKTCDACPSDKPYYAATKVCMSTCPDNNYYDSQKICLSCGALQKMPTENRCAKYCPVGAYLDKVTATCKACLSTCDICTFPNFYSSNSAGCVAATTAFAVSPKAGENYVKTFQLTWPMDVGIRQDLNLELQQRIADAYTDIFNLNTFDANNILSWTFDTYQFDDNEQVATVLMTTQSNQRIELDTIRVTNFLANMIEGDFLTQQTKIETISAKLIKEINRNETTEHLFIQCGGQGTQRSDEQSRCECISSQIGTICQVHVGNALRLLGNYSSFLNNVGNGRTLIQKILDFPNTFNLLCRIKNWTLSNSNLFPYDTKCIEQLKKITRDQFITVDQLNKFMTILSKVSNDSSWKDQSMDIYKTLEEVIAASYKFPAGSVQSSLDQQQSINNCGSKSQRPINNYLSFESWDFTMTLYEFGLKYCEVLVLNKQNSIDIVQQDKTKWNMTNIFKVSLLDSNYQPVVWLAPELDNISFRLNNLVYEENFTRECIYWDDELGDWSNINMTSNDTNTSVFCQGPLKRLYGMYWNPREPPLYGLSNGWLIFFSLIIGLGFFALVIGITVVWYFWKGKHQYARPPRPAKLENSKHEESRELSSRDQPKELYFSAYGVRKQEVVQPRTTDQNKFLSQFTTSKKLGPNKDIGDKIIVELNYQKQGLELDAVNSTGNKA